jgi:putative aldouronate transport system permease protein
MIGKRKSYSFGDIIFYVLVYMFFIAFAFLCTFPIYYIFINSISSNDLVSKGQVMFIPREVHLGNYIEVLKLPGIGKATLVSVLRTVVGSALTLLSVSFLGYLFSKKNMWHKKFWYRFVIITMYFTAGLIPGYLNIQMLGLLDSFWVYVIPGIVPVFHMVLIKTFIEQIPAALEESAQIDGAGYLVRYIKIILPLSTSILATITVFTAVGQWNAFMDTVLYITDKDLYTLQFMLYRYLQNSLEIAKAIQNGSGLVNEDSLQRTMTPTSVQLTITVIVTTPVLMIYPFMQRYFVKGIMIGAVKG